MIHLKQMLKPALSQEALLPVGPEIAEDFGEKCGVFGVYEPGTNVALTTYEGLVKLKHRGQDASGQAVADLDGDLHLFKDLGKVTDVFEEGNKLPQVLPVLGRLAIGHNRYGTMNKVPLEQRWNAAQPIMIGDGRFAGAYNGDVSNITDVMRRHEYRDDSYVSDTEAVMKLIDLYIGTGPTGNIVDSLRAVLPQLEGAFCGVFTDGQRLIGARDPNGFRPFVYGTTASGGHVLASEIRALRQVGASFEQEVQPGSMIVIDDNGVSFEQFAKPTPTPCSYEYFYFSKEDNILDGQVVGDVRYRFGQELAMEHPVEADLVVGVPNSGITSAEAYAKATGLMYEQLIAKNPKSDLRSFLANNQAERQTIAEGKFVIDSLLVDGKSIVVVDDSVIRGTVSKALVQMLRQAGAAEVHVRVPAPIYKYSCHYGMDTGRPEELLASGRNLQEMRNFIGADSLEFLSTDGVLRATRRAVGKLCMACSTGEYPTNIAVNLIK